MLLTGSAWLPAWGAVNQNHHNHKRHLAPPLNDAPPSPPTHYQPTINQPTNQPTHQGCRSGNRSAKACAVLEAGELSYSNLTDDAGGWLGWVDAKLPTET